MAVFRQAPHEKSEVSSPKGLETLAFVFYLPKTDSKLPVIRPAYKVGLMYFRLACRGRPLTVGYSFLPWIRGVA